MKKTIQIFGSIFIASMILLTSCTKEEVNNINDETVNTIENINLHLFLDENFIQLFDADNDFINLLENLNIEEGEDYENLLVSLENVTSESELLDALNAYGTIDDAAVISYINIKEDLTSLIFDTYPELQDLTEEQLVEYWAQEWLVLKSMTTIDDQLQADLNNCDKALFEAYAEAVAAAGIGSMIGTPATGAALGGLRIIMATVAHNRCVKKAYIDYGFRNPRK